MARLRKQDARQVPARDRVGTSRAPTTRNAGGSHANLCHYGACKVERQLQHCAWHQCSEHAMHAHGRACHMRRALRVTVSCCGVLKLSALK